jgi:predicted Zn-dependent protease
MGRELLDRVAAPCSDRNAPGRDAWVRDWYAASLAHQLAQQQFEIRHVARALELFRNDTGILALAGATHETLSTPLMQAGVGDDRALREQLQLQSASGELARSEDLLRQALRRDERQVEARLRLGNVLGLRGKHAEALRELERAVAEAGEDRVVAYYARMLHGRELDAAGRRLDARTAYEGAGRLFPAAPAPRLALSQLLRASGDAAAAAEMLARLVDGDKGDDPWWEYYASAGRFYEQMVRALGAITPAAVRP